MKTKPHRTPLNRSLLLYPYVPGTRNINGSFRSGSAPHTGADHACGMHFIELFDGDKLSRNLGDRLIAHLTAGVAPGGLGD